MGKKQRQTRGGNNKGVSLASSATAPKGDRSNHSSRNKTQGSTPQSSSSSSSSSSSALIIRDLPPTEREHVERCSLDYSNYASSSFDDDEFVRRAIHILQEEHLLIIHNCWSSSHIQILKDCYQRLHQDQAGQRAIGERDPSKRSGTRLYNCKCQYGPACNFYNWKKGTTEAKLALNPSCGNNNSNNSVSDDDEDEFSSFDFCKYNHHHHHSSSSFKTPIWKRITDTFHFTHIARVEVVTSHVGCRAQGWHIDGVHGLTVIIPLTDVTIPKGPTELDFTHDFCGLWEGDGKIRSCTSERVRAVMPEGSILMFNANVSHRGSANISRSDRPILVLDCSLESTCLAAGGPRDIWSVAEED